MAISIFISLIIGVLMCVFLLIGRHGRREIADTGSLLQLEYNLKNGLELSQSSEFVAGTPQWEQRGTGPDSIRITKGFWGAFKKIKVETKNRKHAITRSGLYGVPMDKERGLTVSETGKQIFIAGQIKVRSTCFLPAAGYLPGNIEGRSFISSGLNPYLRPSPERIRGVSNDFLEGMHAQQVLEPGDSLVTEVDGHLDRSFQSSTVVWECGKKIPGETSLKGNIKIVANEIEIDGDAHINDVLILCNKIRFKSGFRGSVHVIAKDSIVMEERCEFDYPSSFVLLAPGGESLRYIQFADNCRFWGSVVAVSNPSSGKDEAVLVKLSSGSEVNGFIYSSGYLHLEGVTHANIIADKLLLKTQSAVYKDYILSCEIDASKFADLLVVATPCAEDKRLICCKNFNGTR